MQKLLELKKVSITRGNLALLDNISLTLYRDQQWAIVGTSGSGKTTLAQAIMGLAYYQGEIIHYPDASNNIKPVFVEQQHHFKNLSNTNEFYYQQRFNAADADNSINVEEALNEYKDERRWIETLRLVPLLKEPLIQLSNGENKRLQLAKALMTSPTLLILDNPFTGLDKEGRNTLNIILNDVCAKGIHLLLITSPTELPDAITHVAILENGRLVSSGKKENTRHDPAASPQAPSEKTGAWFFKETTAPLLDNVINASFTEAAAFTDAVHMRNVTIRYAGKTILHQINWRVRKGECWRIAGPNGAGKSTLLSLITGDNPQAYANEVWLFDKRRGSGESIWDIKKKIGYISPELHLHFDRSSTCFEVIASGLFDTVGLFRILSEEQEKSVSAWIRVMQLERFSQKPLSLLSTGQQRMALLARALVKNPPVLVLDEPCQGLDEQQIDFIKLLIDRLHKRSGTTLIYVSHYDHELPSCINKSLSLDRGVMTIQSERVSKE